MPARLEPIKHFSLYCNALQAAEPPGTAHKVVNRAPVAFQLSVTRSLIRVPARQWVTGGRRNATVALFASAKRSWCLTQTNTTKQRLAYLRAALAFPSLPPPPRLRRGCLCWVLNAGIENATDTAVLREQVVKSEKREGNAWFFLLHYSGWGKRYDEWVAQSGLVKYDADVVSS